MASGDQGSDAGVPRRADDDGPDRRHAGVKVFATTDAAETWFEENDLEGVAFEYEVLE